MLRGDAEALKLLLLMQACAPGPPMIYQGTEVGQIGALAWTAAAATRTTARRFLHERDAWDDDCCRTREVGRLRNDLYAPPTRGLRWCATFDTSGVKRNNQKLIAWERAFADPAAARIGRGARVPRRRRRDGATLVDTGFGANVPVKAAFATKGVVLESTTDVDGRVSVTFPPQSGWWSSPRNARVYPTARAEKR